MLLTKWYKIHVWMALYVHGTIHYELISHTFTQNIEIHNTNVIITYMCDGSMACCSASLHARNNSKPPASFLSAAITFILCISQGASHLKISSTRCCSLPTELVLTSADGDPLWKALIAQVTKSFTVSWRDLSLFGSDPSTFSILPRSASSRVSHAGAISSSSSSSSSSLNLSVASSFLVFTTTLNGLRFPVLAFLFVAPLVPQMNSHKSMTYCAWLYLLHCCCMSTLMGSTAAIASHFSSLMVMTFHAGSRPPPQDHHKLSHLLNSRRVFPALFNICPKSSVVPCFALRCGI